MKNQLLRYALLTLMILNAVHFTFAIEKASDSDAKKSQIIVLNSYAIGDNVSTKENETVPVSITGFQTDSWYILIKNENETILEGNFYSRTARKSGEGTVSFFGRDTNEITGQELNFSFSSFNNQCFLLFKAGEEGQVIELPYNIFVVHNDSPWTSVLFGSSTNLSDLLLNGGLKTGTLKQLKNCLLQNPYIRKI